MPLVRAMGTGSRASRVGAACLALGGLALLACVPPSTEQGQAATPDTGSATVAAAPATAQPARPSLPPPPSEPVFENWMDAPQTPGDWTYLPSAAGGSALFAPLGGAPLLTLHCNRSAGSVSILRAGHTTEALPMRIVTEALERVLDGLPSAAQPPSIKATLNASDPLLDAMAFSKGRFVVEVQGLPTLYVPSWPEVTRVVEDCR